MNENQTVTSNCLTNKLHNGWPRPVTDALKRCQSGDHSEPGSPHPDYHKAWDEAVKAATDDGGFHWCNGIFFKRLDDGSVRMRVFGAFNGVAQWEDSIIPEPEWASIVCSVSRGGETGERWNEAQDFHGR